MKFKHGTRRRAVEYEKDILSYWKKNNTFQKSIDIRSQDNSYVFYDGPPFITGEPHHGTLLSSIVKDAVPRYWTMNGKRVERVWGWDCHGLPAEVFTEKKLGIKDKRDIGTKITLEKYITTCRDNMVATGDLWESTIDRIGRWVDFKGAYKTMDKEYMESVWWAFKELYEKGKIYEGEKVLMYCTRDATPISKAEVAMDNSYQDVTDPSVYVKFKLQNEDKYLLTWTTTPWTLLSNSAIAVNKDLDYVEVEVDGVNIILAENLLSKALTDEKHHQLEYTVINKFKGTELVGKSYEPLFDDYKILIDKSSSDNRDNAFKIWHADFVHDHEGTGIAHESPAYGEEDYLLANENNIPWVLNTDENGFYNSGKWEGQLIWDVNKEIAKSLSEDGRVLRIEYIRHTYPHCHRCGTKLMYRAHPSWFIDIQGQKELMLSENEDINWFPEHIKEGRSKKTIESAPDWNISRDRFWATAMPVWKGTDGNGQIVTKVVGSYKELKELSGIELDDYHRPWVDDVTFEIDGIKYQRIEKVLDCWFESGSMPFAQFHYPFENKEKFEQNFPGDFIAEYVGQVRAWFYYLNAVNVGLSGKKAFKNVIVTGTLQGSDGRKLSKSLGNYTDPNVLMDEYSADSLRFLLLSSPVVSGEDFAVKDKDVGDVARKLSTVWNVYDFFTMYAEVDNWEFNGDLLDPFNDLSNVLDIWIVSKLHVLITDVSIAMGKYDLQTACKPILPFIDDLSNWYVRRSRRRFWKTEDDSDKKDAYRTLHYLLVTLSKVIAPFTPFMAEELYIKLTDKESVHLEQWPTPGGIDTKVIDDMDFVREVINLGLSERSKAQIKIRQPLSSVTVSEAPNTAADLNEMYRNIVLEELNVKQITINSTGGNIKVELDTTISIDLKLEGISREIIRIVQSSRKNAGLNVDDRIEILILSDNPELRESIEKYKPQIMKETLAISEIDDNVNPDFSDEFILSGARLQISIRKA